MEPPTQIQRFGRDDQTAVILSCLLRIIRLYSCNNWCKQATLKHKYL